MYLIFGTIYQDRFLKFKLFTFSLHFSMRPRKQIHSFKLLDNLKSLHFLFLLEVVLASLVNYYFLTLLQYYSYFNLKLTTPGQHIACCMLFVNITAFCYSFKECYMSTRLRCNVLYEIKLNFQRAPSGNVLIRVCLCDCRYHTISLLMRFLFPDDLCIKGLSVTSICVLDKPDVMEEVTEKKNIPKSPIIAVGAVVEFASANEESGSSLFCSVLFFISTEAVLSR